MEVSKRNGSVCFNEEAHRYWDEGDPSKRYVSVTTLIGMFAQPFDEEFWSSYKALERIAGDDLWSQWKRTLLGGRAIDIFTVADMGLDYEAFAEAKRAILGEWAEKNRLSCERGTRIHAEIEESLYGHEDVDISRFGMGGVFGCGEKGDMSLDRERGLYPEYLIHMDDGDLHLAGQIDLLVKDGSEITLADWKTNERMDKAGFKGANMRYPLNNVPDCNFGHYNMQLSIYAYMLLRAHPEFTIKDLVIRHIDHKDKVTVHHLPFLRKEVERLVEFCKRDFAFRRAKDENRRFDYTKEG